jgi:hypothetical protein
MKKLLLFFAVLIAACAQDAVFTDVARQLAGMTFDGGPVTVHGQVGTLVWPEGSSGMILLTVSAEKYAFSTGRVAPMAKQGFSRFTVHPGEELIITGVLASGGQKIGPGFTAARADLITKADGTRVFDRAKLP